MEAYEAGAWDIGTTGFGGIVLGVAKSSLKIIGVTIDDGTVMGLWARPDSDIVNAGYQEETGCYGTAENWKDLEILYTQGTITDIMLTATLECLGLAADDVVRTNMDTSRQEAEIWYRPIPPFTLMRRMQAGFRLPQGFLRRSICLLSLLPVTK